MSYEKIKTENITVKKKFKREKTGDLSIMITLWSGTQVLLPLCRIWVANVQGLKMVHSIYGGIGN